MTKNEAVRAAWKAADAADEYRAPFEAHFIAALGANGYDVVSITERDAATIEALRAENARLREALKPLIKASARLSFAAQTSGGTAGRDDGLCSAIDDLEAPLVNARAAMGESDE